MRPVQRPGPGRLGLPGGNRQQARRSAAAPGAQPSEAAGRPLARSGVLAEYVKVRTVGRGSFGEALLVKHRTSGHLSVLKRVRVEVAGNSVDAASAAESAAREAQVLQKLQHPHIVEFLGAFVDSARDAGGGTLCLLMAYCEGGDVQQRLQKVRQEGRRLPEVPLLRWFDQLCSAMAYVHKHQVLHRDLKPSNIFLSGRSDTRASQVSEEESVSIGDFGVSRPLEHAMELVTTMVGTPCYLSPEVCKGKPYSYKSDIWSLGCVLFEMMALRPPFGTAPNLEALVNRIVRADVPMPENLAAEYPEASRCARAMLRQQPDRRPTAQALLNRPRIHQPTYELPGLALTPAPVNGAGPLPTAPAIPTSTPWSLPAPTPSQPRSPAFDPPQRSASPSVGIQAPQRGLVAVQVAAAAAAATAAISAASALSPRAKGRAKLACKILEAEAEQEHALKAFNDVCDAARPAVSRQVSASAAAASRSGAGSPSPGPGLGVVRRRSHNSAPSSNAPPPQAVAVAVVGGGNGGAPPPSTNQAVRQLSGPGLRGRSSSSGSALRASSGDEAVHRGGSAVAPPAPMPMSARSSKAYKPEPWPQSQVAQRSPRISAPPLGFGMEAEKSSNGRSTSATPRSPRLTVPAKDADSPDDPEDLKRKQRREDRSKQSQAFRQWLREQRAQKSSKDGAGESDNNDSPQAVAIGENTPDSGPHKDEPDQTAEKPVIEILEPSRAQQQRQRLQQPASQQQPTRSDFKTEIYCPGYPVMTVEEEEEEEEEGPRARSIELPPPVRSAALPQRQPPKVSEVPKIHELLPPKPVVFSEAKKRLPPCGPADMGGTPSESIEEAELSDSRGQMPREQAQSHVSGEASATGGTLMASFRSEVELESKSIEVYSDCSAAASQGRLISGQLEESRKSVSIGDRIEGIRACLEARMGTQRFQKLYKSLAKDDGIAGIANQSVPWPRDSSMVLPEEIDEAFVGAGDGGSDDINVLVPLVAKLVACEQTYFS
mmetsp:Transcript_31538/g.57308  ORF Transcript_31538/g.57308 Transcript_31538/m.57308 type:complete len:997 (-) Transcript_31538:61-3051(-)